MVAAAAVSVVLLVVALVLLLFFGWLSKKALRHERVSTRLRFLALGYLPLLLGIPVALVFVNAFQDGVGAAWDAVTTPEAQHAFYLTLVMVAVAVPLNTIFGIVCALAIVRQRFRGRALLNALVDLPFAVSPVVVGLALLLVYGSRDGWFGDWLAEHGIQMIFSTPGDDPRDDVRLAAVRGARGDPGAARDRHRAGAGGGHARRRRVPDLLPRHAARRSAGASRTASCSPPRAPSASSAP